MARFPDPGRRGRQRSASTMGLSSPFVANAARDLDSFPRETERRVFSAEAHSLAAAAAPPCVNRLEMLGVRGVWSASCPRVMDWYDRVRGCLSFEAGVARRFTEDDADRMRPVDAAGRGAEILEP